MKLKQTEKIIMNIKSYDDLVRIINIAKKGDLHGYQHVTITKAVV